MDRINARPDMTSAVDRERKASTQTNKSNDMRYRYKDTRLARYKKASIEHIYSVYFFLSKICLKSA